MSDSSGLVFVSAGEASGDLHAARVVQALKSRRPLLRVVGITGPAMRAAGCETLVDLRELNVMGVVDVLKSLPRIRGVRAKVLEFAAAQRPDAAILVDFPGFHLNIGRKLRRSGVPVLQYIAPKLWAWGAWRSGKLRGAQDALASILPFEPAWFATHGIRAEYVGNPSAAACREGWDADTFFSRAGLKTKAKTLAILPGSRPSEIAHHVGLLADCWRKLREYDAGIQAVAPLAPGLDEEALSPLRELGVRLIPRMQEGFRLHADVAMAVSGTATLELALWDIPTVLVYQTAPLTVFLARRVVKASYIGLANILLDEAAMPELIQEQANAERMVAEVRRLLDDASEAERQKQHFARLRRMLGDADPALAVAERALALAAGGR